MYMYFSLLAFKIYRACLTLCSWVGVEYVHQCRQAAGGGGAAGPDGRVRPRGDLPGRPPARRQNPRLCSPRGAAQSPAGHVCRLPHARQRGRLGGWRNAEVDGGLPVCVDESFYCYFKREIINRRDEIGACSCTFSELVTERWTLCVLRIFLWSTHFKKDN